MSCKDDSLSLSMSDSQSAHISVKQDQSEISLLCPKDLEKGKYLKPIYFVLDNGLVFSDKLLPDPMFQLTPDSFYYAALIIIC